MAHTDHQLSLDDDITSTKSLVDAYQPPIIPAVSMSPGSCLVQAKNGVWCRARASITTHRRYRPTAFGITKIFAMILGYSIRRFPNGERLQHMHKMGLMKCRGTIRLSIKTTNGDLKIEDVNVWDGPRGDFDCMVDSGAAKEYIMPERECILGVLPCG